MTASNAQSSAVQLHEGSDGQVLLTTADSDRFIKTQREIVAAMRGADDMFSRARNAQDQFTQMVNDIRAWCGVRARVESCTLCPRADDVLALIVIFDEDEDGTLDEEISKLDLEMFGRNGFRITWLMLRASEAAGAHAFLDPSGARCIYRAGRGRSSQGV